MRVGAAVGAAIAGVYAALWVAWRVSPERDALRRELADRRRGRAYWLPGHR